MNKLFAIFFICLIAFSSVAQETQKEWVELILCLEGHKSAAFNYGPKLVAKDPQFGLDVVQIAWPDITDY